jgi:hypothetical protein
MPAGMSVLQTAQPPGIRIHEFTPDLLEHATSSLSHATVDIFIRALGHFCQLHVDLLLHTALSTPRVFAMDDARLQDLLRRMNLPAV